MTTSQPTLCYITDRHALEPAPLLPRIQEAAAAGVDLVQIREKDLDTRELLSLVTAAVQAVEHSSTRIIVNDRLDVARATGAGGVHLGTQSMPAERVRAATPAGFIIGVSCHSLGDALAAESAGADYALLGPVFPTPSKLRYGPPLGLEKLREVTARIRIPVLALGGISVERVRLCLEAGAAGIAGISIFQSCDSVDALVRGIRLLTSGF